MSFQTVVLSRYGFEDPFVLPQHIAGHVFFYSSRLHRPCTDLVSLFPLKKEPVPQEGR